MIAELYSAGQSVRYLRHRLAREKPRERRQTPRPVADPDARRIAVHEAGHAVVCAALGGRVGMIVRHPDNSSGSCHGLIPYAAPLAHHVAFHAAGAAAERYLLELKNATPSHDDMRLSERVLAGARGPEKAKARRDGEALAERLIRRHRITVERLADRLTETTLIRGGELAAILKPAQQGQPQSKRQ